jgi:hypothetical protein
MIDALSGVILVRDYASKSGTYATNAVTQIGAWTLPVVDIAAGMLCFDYVLRVSETVLKDATLKLNGTQFRSVDMTAKSLFKDRFELDYQDGGYIYESPANDPLGYGLGTAASFPSVTPTRTAWNRSLPTGITLSITASPACPGGNYRIDYMRIYIR